MKHGLFDLGTDYGYNRFSALRMGDYQVTMTEPRNPYYRPAIRAARVVNSIVSVAAQRLFDNGNLDAKTRLDRMDLILDIGHGAESRIVDALNKHTNELFK